MGAVMVLGVAYLPELLGSPMWQAADGAGAPATAGAETAAGAGEAPQVEFEFDDLLRNSRVAANPEPYVSEPATERSEPERILLQAASFRDRDDADRLRAQLLLIDLPAATEAITLSNGAWYRVTVGPFDSQVKAQRALTQLREMNIAAIRTAG